MKVKLGRLRRAIKEAMGSDDDALNRITNREKMIGRGMDMGTMPYNPSWDYDKKPASSKMRHRMGDEISQVKYVIDENDMHQWLEPEATRNPDVIYLKSGGLSVKVENDYGTFVFSVVKPANWRGWSMECESIDAEIDNVLYELSEYVNEMEGQ